MSIGFFFCCCGAGNRFLPGVEGDGSGPGLLPHSLAWTYSLVLASARIRADDLLRRRDQRDRGTEALMVWGCGASCCCCCCCRLCGGVGGGYEGVCCTRVDFRTSTGLLLVVVAVVMVLVVVAVLGLVLTGVSVSVSLATSADLGLSSSGTCRRDGLGDLSCSAPNVCWVGVRGAGCWL